MYHYEIITWFSRELLLNASCWTTESSQHHSVSCSWMTHITQCNQYSILMYAPLKGSCWTTESSPHSLVRSSWIAHVGLWITTALSLELLLNEWLMLDYGIITTLSRELILNEWLMLDYGILILLSRELLLTVWRWPTEISQHTLVNYSWKTHVGLRNHHSILT
jgi:hypothetical protein